MSGENSYRPAVTLLYFLESALFGTRPFGFHLVQIALHALSGLGLMWVGRRLGLDSFKAALAGFLFVSHPLATESVNAVGFAEESQTLIFLLISMACLLKPPDIPPGHVVAASLAYGLALLSKESAMLFPLAAVLALMRCGAPRRSVGVVAVSMGIVLACYAALRFHIFMLPGDLMGSDQVLPLKTRLLTVLGLVGRAAWMFIAPLGQSAAHVVVIRDAPDATVILSICVLIGLALLIIRQRSFAIRWGGLWCVLFALPAAQLAPIPYFFAERFYYLPMFGACLAAAGSWPGPVRRWSRWMAAAVVLALAILTLNRNPVWRSQDSLFEDALKKNPANPFALYSLGVSAEFKNNVGLAEPFFREALSIKPDYHACRAHLAWLCNTQGRYEAAMDLLEPVIKARPGDGHARLSLAWALCHTGRAVMARHHLDRAARDSTLTTDERATLDTLKKSIGGP